MSGPGPKSHHTFWSVEPVGDEVIVVVESEDEHGCPVRLTISLDPHEAAAIGRTIIQAGGTAYLATAPRART